MKVYIDKTMGVVF